MKRRLYHLFSLLLLLNSLKNTKLTHQETGRYQTYRNVAREGYSNVKGDQFTKNLLNRFYIIIDTRKIEYITKVYIDENVGIGAEIKSFYNTVARSNVDRHWKN